MKSEQKLISNLTRKRIPKKDRREALREYARAFGWIPSDEILEYPGTEELANGHLVVEHGLDNTAVISFLRDANPFDELSLSQQNRLLSISYNNLVDWHLFPDPKGQWCVFNRKQPLFKDYVRRDLKNDVWRAEAFDQVIGRRPNPNLRSLDDALIETVSKWKRILAGELKLSRDTAPIAELFNAIFFVRALEDDNRKSKQSDERLLLHLLEQGIGVDNVAALIQAAISKLAIDKLPQALIDIEALSKLGGLDQETLWELARSFYDNSFAPYTYDFSVMSKHALSRIYEHYISIIRTPPTRQRELFPGSTLPIEVENRDIGGVYTPQYIARFFSRFLKASVSPRAFRSLKVVDPACGSGMFLRTILEMQCDLTESENVQKIANLAFSGTKGIDVERNACKAARLSLTLLHIVLTGKLPDPVPDITNAEAISYLRENPGLKGSFDAVIANPPYVRWESIPPKWQEELKIFFGESRRARLDLYLAFVKWGLDCVRPGGLLLFVLPHAFLIAKNAEGIRKELREKCAVKVLADLSDLDVFEHANSYPILLVAEKATDENEIGQDDAIVVRCGGFAGHALHDALKGTARETPFYSIYQVPQKWFLSNSWKVLSPKDFELQEKISRHMPLADLVTISQGMVTGMDDIFVRKRADVPDNELSAYAPLLRDRDMKPYGIPSDSDWLVLYPFDRDRLLEPAEIEKTFPATWDFLSKNRNKLEARPFAQKDPSNWWRPERPRLPSKLLRRKIVTPHLVLYPRFSVDFEGKFAISRSPYVYLKREGDEPEMLRYLLGVLNSSVAQWQIATQSHKYSRGYARLEIATLQSFFVPSPSTVPTRMMNRIQTIVQALIDTASQGDGPMQENETELNGIIADLYGLRLQDLEKIATPE